MFTSQLRFARGDTACDLAFIDYFLDNLIDDGLHDRRLARGLIELLLQRQARCLALPPFGLEAVFQLRPLALVICSELFLFLCESRCRGALPCRARFRLALGRLAFEALAQLALDPRRIDGRRRRRSRFFVP
jgi:hypothetical protein